MKIWLTDRLGRPREVFAWALYDWANSAFATVVIAGFFPLFFKAYWSEGVDATVSTFRLGVANSVASLLVLLVAPVLGAIADRDGFKKTFLRAFALLGITCTAALYFVGQGHWELAVVCYVGAGIGFAAGNIFYDALIFDVSDRGRLDVISAFGFSLGYLGGGLVFALCVAMTLWPATFGLAGKTAAVQFSFLITAAWWALFTLPLLVMVPESRAARPPLAGRIGSGLRRVMNTLRKLRHHRDAFLFLLAYWLYIDAVDTIIRMAVDYGMALGFDTGDLIAALLLTQFVGFPAALAFGWLGSRIGPQRGIFIGIFVYMGITVWGYYMDSTWEFYGIAVVIGLVQGGVQALSRSLFARLIPDGEAAEYFGFYNLVGKFAAIIGPALMGWVAVATGDNRTSLLSLLVLFGLGALLLSRVRDPDT
ncbi:MAG: MFS transporter [Gammaproteobacteria bacterium]|nr:MFS transporter [Gammaproteobacteria bacterium]